MGSADKDNEMIDKYRYGEDGYAVIWPYDVDMEAIMYVIEKIQRDNEVSCNIDFKSYTFGTADGWTCDVGNTQGTGGSMRDACYNAIVKFITNENKEENSE